MLVMPDYTTQRPAKTAPHVSLRCLRLATNQTLEQVAEAVTEILGKHDKPIGRGTISAIEGGHRGASRSMLDALAVAYGLESGDITTDYAPRSREQIVEAV